MRSYLRIAGQGCLVAALVLSVGCDEKAASSRPQVSNKCDPSKDDSCDSTAGDTDNLCKDLKANAAAVSAHSSLLSDLCDPYKTSSGATTTTLIQLRKPERVYKGGSPMVTELGKELANKQSQMDLYTSNIYDTDATSYYKLMRLQMFKPSEFDDAGFESDENIKYTIQTQGNNDVSFNYLNDAETTIVVNYDAKTTFYEIQSSDSGIRRYVVGTKLVQSKETVLQLEGIVVINEYQVSGKLNAEVFTMSSQLYDNNGDHATTLRKAKTNLEKEQVRSFKNAGKSRGYFKE